MTPLELLCDNTLTKVPLSENGYIPDEVMHWLLGHDDWWVVKVMTNATITKAKCQAHISNEIVLETNKNENKVNGYVMFFRDPQLAMLFKLKLDSEPK